MMKARSQSLVRLAKCLLLTAFLLDSPLNQAMAQMAGTPQIGQVLSKAAALSKQGDFDGAAEAYRQAIHISPNDPMLYLYLGLALENKGSYPEAAKVYDDAIALQQKKSYMPSLLAKLYAHASAAYLMTNHLEKANARADKSLQLNPNSADTLSAKGVILDMQGHLHEAIEYDRKAYALDPRSPVFAENLAGVLQKKGRCARRCCCCASKP
jgi:protein O-GlcNAc transferase